jgi:hypothetical protein
MYHAHGMNVQTAHVTVNVVQHAALLHDSVQAQQLVHAGIQTMPSRRLAALGAASEEDKLEALVLQNLKVQLTCCITGLSLSG